jgi:hypothetical protein
MLGTLSVNNETNPINILKACAFMVMTIEPFDKNNRQGIFVKRLALKSLK